MGTQQLLMIVLSIIVVGAAVAVGIMMFDTQSKNQTINAIYTDLSQIAVDVQAYWRTPKIMGGAGFDMPNITVNSLVTWFNINEADPAIKTANGSYLLNSISLANPFIDIHLSSEPPNRGWIATARVFFDGRSNAARGIHNGIWTYIGPENGAPTPPGT